MFRSLMTIALLLVTLPAAAETLPNRPVNRLDLARYTGRWHEIAHLPMFFERKCLDAVTATYTPNTDGSIHVRNTCRTDKGPMTVDGMARIAPDRPAAFKVRFAPAWLTWLPAVWDDYWVIDVDVDYQWAVVGSPGHKYLWVLSRRPTMNRQLFQAIRERAKQRGYPIDKLIMMAPLD